MVVLSILKDFQKSCRKFREIYRDSSKFSKIFGDLKLHTFEKLLLKNAIKDELWGYLKLHKFGGPPKITLVKIYRLPKLTIYYGVGIGNDLK